jgi:hypothetical protein
MANIFKAIILVLAGECLAMTLVAAPACTAVSGEKTTALVELYTSEGCSSCPPADAWLRDAPSTRYRPDQLVPLALHVPYWDDLGWKDGFAQAAFAQRQSRLAGMNGHSTVFTPHFFVSGVEKRAWARGLDAEIQRVNQMPAAAHVAVSASMPRPGRLTISSEAKTAVSTEGTSLFLAVTESRLASTVRAGENRGSVLRHDHVVRALIGPLAMPGGNLAEHRDVILEPGWQTTHLGVVAFVQDGRNGRVLQAATCALGG